MIGSGANPPRVPLLPLFSFLAAELAQNYAMPAHSSINIFFDRKAPHQSKSINEIAEGRNVLAYQAGPWRMADMRRKKRRRAWAVSGPNTGIRTGVRARS